MDNFLNNLYSYDNFGIYLIIAIVILVILFFVILFFGKKDKKNRELEETKRLEKLNPDLFKIDNAEKPIENIEDNKIEEEIKPIINEPTIEPEVAIVEEKEEITTPDLTIENEPILEKEEEKPLIIMDENENLPEVPLYNPQEIKKEVEEIKVAETKEEPVENIVIETKEEEKSTVPNMEIFSSVYVPKEDNIEMPSLEYPKEEKEVIKVDTIEEDDFELPALKSEDEEKKVEDIPKEKESVNVFSNFDLDSISGESYNINK